MADGIQKERENDLADVLTEVNAEISRLIDRLVARNHPDGFEDRDLYPGSSPIWRGRHPLPGPALAAAAAVRMAASRAERSAIELARGRGGLSWEHIGRLLGLEADAKDAGVDLGVAAWAYATYRVRPGVEPPRTYRWTRFTDTFTWRCWTCEKTVYEGHPDNGVYEAQDGHARGCRHLARYALADRRRTT